MDSTSFREKGRKEITTLESLAMGGEKQEDSGSK